jgi:hypothetical protein
MAEGAGGYDITRGGQDAAAEAGGQMDLRKFW